MSTLTLPHVAGLFMGDPQPWYAARSTLDGAIAWQHRPELPPTGWEWAEDGPDIYGTHIVLDEVAVAELLFCSPIDPANTASQIAARELVLAQLDAVHCDLGACVAKLSQAYGDHPEATARRMGWCRTLAEQLLAESVPAPVSDNEHGRGLDDIVQDIDRDIEAEMRTSLDGLLGRAAAYRSLGHNAMADYYTERARRMAQLADAVRDGLIGRLDDDAIRAGFTNGAHR